MQEHNFGSSVSKRFVTIIVHNKRSNKDSRILLDSNNIASNLITLWKYLTNININLNNDSLIDRHLLGVHLNCSYQNQFENFQKANLLSDSKYWWFTDEGADQDRFP